MEAQFVSTLLWCLGAALLGSVLFTFIGLIAGTSETATIAPAVLLVVLVGFPPAAVFTFCIAAVAAKHIIHAVPTAILGVPGDNMAIPMLEPCAALRALGAPHMALQKMISGAVLGMVLSIPIAVSFALLLAPLGKLVQAWSGLIFTIVAIGIAYASKGRWASIFMLIPFGLLIQAFEKLAVNVNGNAGLGKSPICSAWRWDQCSSMFWGPCRRWRAPPGAANSYGVLALLDSKPGPVLSPILWVYSPPGKNCTS